MIDQANTAEDAFLKALQGEDELGMVIRAHIHIEHHLNELLNMVIPYPGYLKAMQLDYAGKVNLAGATGLRPDIVSPLLALGKLRNQMAHRLGTKITKSRERNFYKTFGCWSPGLRSRQCRMRVEIACVTSPAHVAMFEKGVLDGCATLIRILNACQSLQIVSLAITFK